MTQKYNAPQWEYINGQTKRGRPLLLLSCEDLLLANSFLQKKIKRSNWLDKKANYNQNLTDKIANEYVSETNLLLKYFEKLDSITDREIDTLNKLNQNLNRMFSEDGWRKIRFEIRQMKKRTKQVRLEISKQLFEQLQEIKAKERLDTTNSAIEYLIDNYNDNTKELI